MKITPIWVFISYLLIIFLCSILYFIIPDTFEDEINFGDSLYFSVVTITTLGYGDMSPISGIGKALAGFEAFLGVVLMGIFLFAVTHQLVEKQERKIIDAAKLNLKAQYESWKKDIIYSLLFLSEPGKGVKADLATYLLDVGKFREYFEEDKSKRWYAIANNLSSGNYYSNEIIHGLESLQLHIETFIAITRIDQADVLKQLTQYINHLRSLRRRDLDEHEDQKALMGGLWSILTQWDFSTGYHDGDILLKTVNQV